MATKKEIMNSLTKENLLKLAKKKKVEVAKSATKAVLITKLERKVLLSDLPKPKVAKPKVKKTVKKPVKKAVTKKTTKKKSCKKK